MKKSSPLILFTLVVLLLAAMLAGHFLPGSSQDYADHSLDRYWEPPDTSLIPQDSGGALIRYGRELIAHTASYLGPRGSVAPMSNGMNCQNCHLDAGTRFWGNNFGAVQSTYPKLRARSGQIATIADRINDCMLRSLNGQALDSNSREMRAMEAYMAWLGRSVPPKEKPVGSGIRKLALMDRAADSTRGEQIFLRKCTQCHGADGQGKLNASATEYVYPPLWGPHSFNDGAGIYRLSVLAGYVYDNMPFGASYNNRQLSEQEAWDLAAFIDSRPRPRGDTRNDWPDISQKPFDQPVGPYSDSFPESRHKFGPFGGLHNAPRK